MPSTAIPVQPSTSSNQDGFRRLIGPLRPWNHFFDLNTIQIPNSLAQVEGNLSVNSSYYLTNYLLIYSLVLLFAMYIMSSLLFLVSATPDFSFQ